VQLGRLAVYPPGDAREDWTIIRALSDVMGHKLPFDNLRQVRARMIELNANFLNVDQAVTAPWKPFGTEGTVSDGPLAPYFDNFYMTNSISRASETMARCTDIFVRGAQGKTGTDG
jgi:NADH-quinone oxidoreductase subunit G